jgi:molybdopterin/thiamine biosynthesis adenylyltransferase
VEELGLFRAQRRFDASTRGGADGLEGEILVDGHAVTLQLVLDTTFPLCLPRFYLQPWDALGFIPHVDKSGLVCFTDPEGLVIDRRRPLDVVVDSLERAVRILSDGVSGRNKADFVDELEAHWQRLPNSLKMISVLDPGDKVGGIWIAVDHEATPKQWYVAGVPHDISAFFNGAGIGKKVTFQNGLFVPLEPGSSVVPPSPSGQMWSAAEARRVLLGGLSEANRVRLLKATKSRPGFREYVIVGVPRPSGGDAIVGLGFEQVGPKHPLCEGGTAGKVVPIQLERRERSFMIPRGGGDADLGSKRILIAGGGAVGSPLAFELARAGILDLTVIDPDSLTADNTFRHALGRRHWGKRKAQALKDEIEAELPYIRVTPIVDTIENALAASSIRLRDYDLVVSALGNPTVELALNERLHTEPDSPAALFVWVEPLGIGGHTLLVNNSGDGGCFECLYTDPDGDEQTLANRAAFAAPGQSFGRALSGCGSLHTPYGALDAQQTASLAARLAIDALTGRELGNPLLSWKGDPRAFEAAGFRLSERYNTTRDQIDRQRYAYKTKYCPVCGSPGGYQ